MDQDISAFHQIGDVPRSGLLPSRHLEPAGPKGSSGLFSFQGFSTANRSAGAQAMQQNRANPSRPAGAAHSCASIQVWPQAQRGSGSGPGLRAARSIMAASSAWCLVLSDMVSRDQKGAVNVPRTAKNIS